MPHGFFTIERWDRRNSSGESQWVVVRHLDGRQRLTDAVKALEKLGRPGFYRVVQTQRMIWAERIGGVLKLRQHHAMEPETLSKTARAFERDAGKWPRTTSPRAPRRSPA